MTNQKNKMIPKGAIVATTCLLVAVGGSARGQCEVQKLTAPDAAMGDVFGDSVAISDDIAVVGAWGDGDHGPFSGSAHVFRFDGAMWNWEQKLLASDGAVQDEFGRSVATNGEVVLVGAYRDDVPCNDCNSGSVYVFCFSGSIWVQEQKLVPSDNAGGDQFGWSVAISGDVAVIGARGDADQGGSTGSAYVFRYNGSVWEEEYKLLASDGASGDEFGYSVAIDGDAAVIGTPFDDDNGIGSGSAYVFRFQGSSWSQEAKLTASDGAMDDQFGRSVAISGDTIVVGAWHDEDNGDGSGSAYIYQFDGSSWEQDQKLLPANEPGQNRFGWSVAIDGDEAMIGAPFDSDAGVHSGSAYVFGFNGSEWVQEDELHASDAEAEDMFGRAVSISNGVAVIGAFEDDDACPKNPNCKSGSAYVFLIGAGQDCNVNGVSDVCDIITETSSDVNGNGVPDDCEPCVQADVDGDGVVAIGDFLLVLAQWGPCPPQCLGDVDGDGEVGILDFLLLLANWGPCP